MPRTKKDVAVVTAGPTKQELATLDQQLANEAAAISQQIGAPGGNTIKVQPSGNFLMPDGFDLGKEIQVVVVDFISANRFYPNPFVKGENASPECYALGRVIADMAPEDDSPHKESPTCGPCKFNQFGSGTNGIGKACKNTRDLIVALVDPNDPEGFKRPNTPLYKFSVAPNSLKYFDGFVSQISKTLGPPIKAIVTIVGENKGTYASTTFVDPVPNPYYAIHAARRAECEPILFRHPDFAAAATRPATKRPQARRAAGAR